MGDDIVTLLRAAARSGDLALGVSFDCDAVADEIERLRAAGDALAESVETALYGYSLDIYKTLAEWKELRRG